MEWGTALLLGLALGLGAFVQSGISFGMSAVAAPFVVMLAPELIPGALLVTSTALPVLQLAHAGTDIAWRPLGWALAGRTLLTPVGVAIVALTSTRVIAAVVGVLLLLSVALSVWALEVRPTARNTFVAGGLGGISGTAASIGGPFLAIVMQHEKPERLRATMAAFFLVGSLVAMGGLALAHQITSVHLLTGAVWLPFVAAGYAAAVPVRARLPRELLRRLVLGFCVVAGVAVLVRAVVA